MGEENPHTVINTLSFLLLSSDQSPRLLQRNNLPQIKEHNSQEREHKA